MKFAATILLLAISAACISGQYVTIWGNVQNARLLAQEQVVVASGWLQVRERTVTYRSNGPVIVRGIMHLDWKTQSRVTPSISQGGIGQTMAAIRIISQRGHGINSTVRFFA